ncbi:MAG: hypothetical protein ACW98I_21365 [Candidatus Hodarchaeales archaeon]|jgi:aryl-alcohol dehydrogenase-like predicted oxidoreductase
MVEIELQYENLGKNGLEVSRLYMGCFSFGNCQRWQLEIEEARSFVEKTLDLGINSLDTSDIYSLKTKSKNKR